MTDKVYVVRHHVIADGPKFAGEQVTLPEEHAAALLASGHIQEVCEEVDEREEDAQGSGGDAQ